MEYLAACSIEAKLNTFHPLLLWPSVFGLSVRDSGRNTAVQHGGLEQILEAHFQVYCMVNDITFLLLNPTHCALKNILRLKTVCRASILNVQMSQPSSHLTKKPKTDQKAGLPFGLDCVDSDF